MDWQWNLIALELLMIEQIPQLGGKTGARAYSAWPDDRLYFAFIPRTTRKNHK
jgi:hypothetical protein